MAETELVTIINAIPALIEQLGKAFFELELYKDATLDKVQLKEIEHHFRNLETLMVNKFLELDVRANAFRGVQSDAQMLIASREADVAVKEQDLSDRIQELKDAAVAAIIEARLNHPLESLEADVGDSKGGQVRSPLGDKNELYNVPEEKSPGKTAENAEGLSGEIKLRPELVQLCEQVDVKGLLNFVTENQKNITSIFEELTLALETASEPGRLVLASVECFYPSNDLNQEANKTGSALQGMRQSCLMLIKAMATLLAKADPVADNLLNPEIKQQAKAIADNWKPTLADTCNNATIGNSLEVEAFLQLLATFRIASEFDEEELCKLVLAVAHHRQAPELCRSLGLTQKMPGVIEALVNSGRQIDAACFINAFQLSERFSLVPLLKEYLENSKRINQGEGDNFGTPAGMENVSNAQELAALKKIIQCVKDYKLEMEFPLDPLQRRLAQLEKPNVEKKRFPESGKNQQSKKQRANGRSYGFRTPSANSIRQGPAVFGDRATYSGMPESYPPAAPSLYNYQVDTSHYTYQAPHQPTYPQQGYDQRSYYYSQDDRVSNTSYDAASSNYSSYLGGETQPPHQPYM